MNPELSSMTPFHKYTLFIFLGASKSNTQVGISGIICFYGSQIPQISLFYVTLPWDTIDPLIGVSLYTHTPIKVRFIEIPVQDFSRVSATTPSW